MAQEDEKLPDGSGSIHILQEHVSHHGKGVVINQHYHYPIAGERQDVDQGDARRRRGVAQDIEDALQRKQRLERAGHPIEDILAEIRRLKREHRQGGQLRRGDVLGERYLLTDPIGHGGFATVWRARDSAIEEDVALKVLYPNVAGNPEQRRRFFRGARIMADLAHPGIVRIREREAEDDGFYYLVMDLVPRGNLHDAVIAGHVHREQTVPFLLCIGEALTEAHARGHVHRDIKPANILLTEMAEPLLTDFDLATAQDTTGGTRTGALGTFLYAPPEMMDRPQEADARADVYGLGMTAIFVLHGARLPLAALTNRQRFIDDLACSQVLKETLKQATAEQAEDRHENAAALCDALRATAGHIQDGPRAAKRMAESTAMDTGNHVARDLQSADEQEQLSALTRVAMRRSSEHHDTVVERMLNSESAAVRQRAAWTLDHLHDQRSTAALLQALHDPEWPVRSSAGWALVHLGNVIRKDVEHLDAHTANEDAREMARLVLERLPQ